MGSSLTKKDLKADRALPLMEKMKDLSITTSAGKKEAFYRIFKDAEKITVTTLLFNICILLIELKDLNIQDYHQQRIALSFFSFYSSINHKVIDMEDLPLEMPITKKIFDDMLNKWWNDNKEISQIFLIPMRLTLHVVDIASYVKDNTLEINNRFIIFGGQPLDPTQKICNLNILIGRKTSGTAPNIPFSQEEPFVSRKHSMIGFSYPLDFYLIDFSKTLNTSFMIPKNRFCLLKPSMVIEFGLIHRFFVDLIEPFVDPPANQEDEDLIVRIDNIEEKKNESPEENEISSKDPTLRIKFFNGLLKNLVFLLKPKEKKSSFTIGRDPENFIHIPDVNLDTKCGEILFDEKYGWIIKSSGIEEGDQIVEDKKSILPRLGN